MAKATEFRRREVRFAVLVFAVCIIALPAWTQSRSARHTRRSAFSQVKTGSAGLTFAPGLASTAAGTGVSGYSGDGGQATSAQFNSPMGMARDGQGNVFVADFANSVVRKLSADGTVSTVAGTGSQGYSGDGGPATSAQLAFPSAVAVDNNGDLFIADYFNGCVRKVDAKGTISTLATASGFFVRGVAADGSGNVYFSSSYEGVWKVDALGVTTKIVGNGTPGFSGDGGLATDAQTSGVAGMTLDNAGNLYFAEVLNSDIRKVDTKGIITTIAGNQQFGYDGDGGPATNAKMNGPTDIRADAAGDLYIVDSSNNRIRKVNAAGTISTIVGDGNYGYAGDGRLASAAQFAGPTSLAMDGRGNLLIADTGNSVLRGIDVETTTLDFGTVTVGQTAGPIVVTVSNIGDADLNLGSIAASGGFAVQTTCSTTAPLAPGAECTLGMSFIPTGSGSITGTVTLTDNAAGNPHVVNLKGAGVVAANPDFAIAMSRPSLTIGTHSTGSLTVNVTPSGSFSATVSLNCAGLPANSKCSFLPTSLRSDGSNAPLSSVLTISTGVDNVAALAPAGGSVFLAISGAFGAGLLGLVFAPKLQRRSDSRSKHVRVIHLLLVLVILCGGLVGCGTLGSKITSTPPGSYPVTVTGTAQGTVHNATFTLIVQ